MARALHVLSLCPVPASPSLFLHPSPFFVLISHLILEPCAELLTFHVRQGIYGDIRTQYAFPGQPQSFSLVLSVILNPLACAPRLVMPARSFCVSWAADLLAHLRGCTTRSRSARSGLSRIVPHVVPAQEAEG